MQHENVSYLPREVVTAELSCLEGNSRNYEGTSRPMALGLVAYPKKRPSLVMGSASCINHVWDSHLDTAGCQSRQKIEDALVVSILRVL